MLDACDMRVYIPAVSKDNDVIYFEVQSLFSKGTGTVCITGQVAENIRESVLLALSIINHFYFNLSEKDVHVHFTDGSFYKEGTSCGLAIIISLLDSLGLLNVPQSRILASGEIDLYGNIYKVGGVKEKTQNIDEDDFDLVIFPEENQGEISSHGIPIKYLKNIDDFIREYAIEKNNILL